MIATLLLLLQQSASVVMLGTGTPNPDPERSGPAVAVVVNGTAYLVDAGAGVMRRAAAAAARHQLEGLRARRIGTVFLTHLHSDHTIGLPDVIHTGWVAEREAPLRLIGPPGTAAMAAHLTEAYRADIANRTTGLQPHTVDGWRVDASDVAAAGVVYQDSNVVVTAVPVPHDGWEYAYGYRFQTRDMVVVISGDTRPSQAIIDACDGCDILVHEVYSTEGFARRPPDWQAYHADAHTSSAELATIAGRARPRLLVLYHQLHMGTADEDLVREIREAGYGGPVVSARDLDRYPDRATFPEPRP
ncbi:MAG TPA: MBL fold metallo-hydrolase [Gemmatimonadales bacterium]|nr:MBL fold metallo-hydrolase [Gemmatimonadales bacterium]